MLEFLFGQIYEILYIVKIVGNLCGGDDLMGGSEEFTVSDNIVRHVFRRHRDWVSMMGLQSVEDVRTFMLDVLKRPDNIYRDVFHNDVRYFLRRVSDEHWLCVITVGSEARTAYLISQKKYVGIGLQDGYNISTRH